MDNPFNIKPNQMAQHPMHTWKLQRKNSAKQTIWRTHKRSVDEYFQAFDEETIAQKYLKYPIISFNVFRNVLENYIAKTVKDDEKMTKELKGILGELVPDKARCIDVLVNALLRNLGSLLAFR